MCGRSRQRVRALVMVILLLGALGGRAGAQPAPVQPASLPEALARLDSETLAERERAAEFLRDDPAVSLADLQAVLAAGGLSAEQARRVSEIAKAKFASVPRGALGVRFDATFRDRVFIEATYPQFDSARVLEPGDLIVAAEGVELRGPNCWVRFKALINSCEPGERIELTVRRGAAPRFRAQVTLGSYRELLRQGPGAADLNPRDLARAWKARQARLGLRPGPAPLDPGVDAAQWLRGELEAAQGASTAMARRGDRGVYRRAVYAGGEPRAWPEDPDELNQFMATQGKFEGQIPQVQLQLMNEAADEVRAAMPIEEEIRTLERALDYFRQVRDGPVAQPGPAGPAAAPNLDRVALLEKELAAVRAEAGLGPESDAARPDAGGAP